MSSKRTILYVGAKLPALSETFVWRELLGLRHRGSEIIPASVRAPDIRTEQCARPLRDLAAEARIVYSFRTFAHLLPAVIRRPSVLVRLLADCSGPGHDNFRARAKHLLQGLGGMALATSLRSCGIGHVHAQMANTPATVALYAARTLGVPFSFTGHAADLFLHRSALELKLRRAAFVACISDWHRRFYQEQEPALTAKLPIVRCSVSVPDAPNLESGRGIVAVGRLVPKKGFDILLRAYAQLSSFHDSVALTIVGDGPERERLAGLAQQLGLTRNLHFAGAQPHEQVLDSIRKCALFVLPCRTASDGDRDGIPVVLMEAMAAGRAVIAGSLPTIAELVEHERTGLLVAPDDPDALSASLLKLLSDADLRKKLGAAAWERVRDEFSDEVNQSRLEAAIDRASREHCR